MLALALQYYFTLKIFDMKNGKGLLFTTAFLLALANLYGQRDFSNCAAAFLNQNCHPRRK